MPIYTAAKHGVTGFVRSYGKYLPEEKITLNSVNPNVIRTNISSADFYEKLEGKDLLTPIEGVVDAFERLLGSNDTSGEVFEIGPHWKEQGPVKKDPAEYLDEDSKKILDLIHERSHSLHRPR